MESKESLQREEREKIEETLVHILEQYYGEDWDRSIVSEIEILISQTQKDTITRMLELLPHEQNHASSSDPTRAEKTIAIYADGYNHYRKEIKSLLIKELENL